jgi:hypothetical protein
LARREKQLDADSAIGNCFAQDKGPLVERAHLSFFAFGCKEQQISAALLIARRSCQLVPARTTLACISVSPFAPVAPVLSYCESSLISYW